MGVGGIFLHGWIHNQTAVPRGDNRFCSITTFHGGKSDFLLKMWCFGALPAHTKSTQKSKFLTARNFPAHAALVQGLSLHKKGTHQVSGKSGKGCRKKQGRGGSMPPTVAFALRGKVRTCPFVTVLECSKFALARGLGHLRGHLARAREVS